MNDRQEVTNLLQDIAQLCRDGQEGYRNSAEHVKSSELRTFFNQQSLQRGSFAGEIEQEIQRMGEPDPKRSGTVAGSVHRAWINLKAGLGGGDHAILSSVESGEDAAKEDYEKAFAEDLPESVQLLLRKQYQSIIAAHDFVKRARDERKAA